MTSFEGGPRGLQNPRSWHRGYAEKKIAGVACAAAENLGVSVSLVRAAFVLLCLFHGFGFFLYAALWLVIPPEPGGSSPVDRVVESARGLVGGKSRDDEAKPGKAKNGNSDEWSQKRS
jgi:phage shock protein PspC (stress-responsive transcriptional regulator)